MKFSTGLMALVISTGCLIESAAQARAYVPNKSCADKINELFNKTSDAIGFDMGTLSSADDPYSTRQTPGHMNGSERYIQKYKDPRTKSDEVYKKLLRQPAEGSLFGSIEDVEKAAKKCPANKKVISYTVEPVGSGEKWPRYFHRPAGWPKNGYAVTLSGCLFEGALGFPSRTIYLTSKNNESCEVFAVADQPKKGPVVEAAYDTCDPHSDLGKSETLANLNRVPEEWGQWCAHNKLELLTYDDHKDYWMRHCESTHQYDDCQTMFYKLGIGGKINAALKSQDKRAAKPVLDQCFQNNEHMKALGAQAQKTCGRYAKYFAKVRDMQKDQYAQDCPKDSRSQTEVVQGCRKNAESQKFYAGNPGDGTSTVEVR